jgi:hypothetical protein
MTTVAFVVNNESSRKPRMALMHRHRSSKVPDPHFHLNSRLADRNWVQKAATRSLWRTPTARDRQSRTKSASCHCPNVGCAFRFARRFNSTILKWKQRALF